MLPLRTVGHSPATRRWLPLMVALAAIVVSEFAAAGTDGTDVRSYRDPVGDQYLQPGCGDIRRLTVSDRRGVIALTVEIRGLKCLAVVFLDTDRDRHIDYSLLFRRNMSSRGTVEEVWHWAADDRLSDARAKLLGASRKGDRYTFSFGAAAVGVKRAFGFEAHIDGHIPSLVTDSAPDDPDGWFTYRLTGG